MKKLVLAVIDAMKPAMLERAVQTLRTPAIAALIERGQLVEDCVAAFPSVTPVCAASIATGTGPAEHEIPSMNWWHRGHERYVEYGTSFGASRAFGIRQSLTDTIYNMNLEHLSRDVQTVFERLDDEMMIVESLRQTRAEDHEALLRNVPPAAESIHIKSGTKASQIDAPADPNDRIH